MISREQAQRRNQSFGDNFRRYWKQHVFGHFLTPAAAMALAVFGYPVAAVVPGFQMLRQLGGFWEKADTLSHDTAWIVAGAMTGVVAGVVARAVWGQS